MENLINLVQAELKIATDPKDIESLKWWIKYLEDKKIVLKNKGA